jgi:cbb3-type cytochrome oxidase subunit 3
MGDMGDEWIRIILFLILIGIFAFVLTRKKD